MIDAAKIRDSNQFNTNEAEFLVEIAERLDRVIGSPLPEAECVALMRVLSIYDFSWDDGFSTVSAERGELVGTLGAAWIASAFTEDINTDGDWLYQMIIDGNCMQYDHLIEPLIKRILSASDIRLGLSPISLDDEE